MSTESEKRARLVELQGEMERLQSELTGDVEAVTSDGFRINSEQLRMKLSKLDVVSPGRVTAETPVGNLVASYMHLFVPEGQSDAQLLFTGGVKLLYEPSEGDK